MKQNVILSILGRQSYMDQEPENLELVTEGTMEDKGEYWEICYEESELTDKSTSPIFPLFFRPSVRFFGKVIEK